MGAASAAAEGRKHHARAAIVAAANGRIPLRMHAPMVNARIRTRMPATARNARIHIHTLVPVPSVRIRIHIPAPPASIRIRSRMRVPPPRIMAIAMPRAPRWTVTGVLRKTPATSIVASIATMRRTGRISRQRIPVPVVTKKPAHHRARREVPALFEGGSKRGD